MSTLLFTVLGWLAKALFTAVLPFVVLVSLAVLVGTLRAGLLLIACPVLVVAVVLDRSAIAAGYAAPLPRLPRLAEVTL